MTSEPLVLIPARLESRRLPGKALADVGGQPMVIRCANNAASAGLKAYVCSDSPAILEACMTWGVDHLETPAFGTGTDRCTWAAQQLEVDTIVILQGDEPLIGPQALKQFSTTLSNNRNLEDWILNGLSPLDIAAAHDPNNVKAVQHHKGSISTLSRAPITFDSENKAATACLKQLGLYGGSRLSFEHFSALGSSPMELTQSIEMLRWLDAGLALQGVVLQTPGISVDTQEDLLAARHWLTQTSSSSAITTAAH
jgi:3-deoxy-manno-octulosonate cytidylyltransferase (CMP-KDO synthetase)